MAQEEPSSVLDDSATKESDSLQQYIEVGSNMFLGTKDGMKYTLVQTSDNKLRLVEAPSELNLDASKESFENTVKKDEVASIVHSSEWKEVKVLQPKGEITSCKGQGDEFGNTVLSPNTVLSFDDSDNTLVKISVEESATDSSQLTYTTLLPRQEKLDPISNFDYSSPCNPYLAYSSSFPLPPATRPSRGGRRQRMLLNEGNSQYLPAPRARGSTPRQRRPRQSSMYQCRSRMLHSTPNTSSNISFISSESPISVTGSSSGSYSSACFNKSQLLSIEYPRAPNNTPVSDKSNTSSEDSSGITFQWMPGMSNEIENFIPVDPRETHNEKERKRRQRIKNACQCLRDLLPFITEKTDNASVFEHAVHFIAFIRDTIGNNYDMEFIDPHHMFQNL